MTPPLTPSPLPHPASAHTHTHTHTGPDFTLFETISTCLGWSRVYCSCRVNFSDVSLYSTNLIFKIVLITWCLLICCLVSYKVVFAEASSWLLSRQTAKNATKNTKHYLTSHRSKLLLASVVRGLSAMHIFIGHTTKKCPIKNCVSSTCSTFCVNMAAPVV